MNDQPKPERAGAKPMCPPREHNWVSDPPRCTKCGCSGPRDNQNRHWTAGLP